MRTRVLSVPEKKIWVVYPAIVSPLSTTSAGSRVEPLTTEGSLAASARPVACVRELKLTSAPPGAESGFSHTTRPLPRATCPEDIDR